MKSDYFRSADNLSTSETACERPLLLRPHTNVLIAARNDVGTWTSGPIPFISEFLPKCSLLNTTTKNKQETQSRAIFFQLTRTTGMICVVAGVFVMEQLWQMWVIFMDGLFAAMGQMGRGAESSITSAPRQEFAFLSWLLEEIAFSYRNHQRRNRSLRPTFPLSLERSFLLSRPFLPTFGQVEGICKQRCGSFICAWARLVLGYSFMLPYHLQILDMADSTMDSAVF